MKKKNHPIAKFEVTIYSDGDAFIAPLKFSNKVSASPKPYRFEDIQNGIRKQLHEYFNMIIDIEVRPSKLKK